MLGRVDLFERIVERPGLGLPRRPREFVKDTEFHHRSFRLPLIRAMAGTPPGIAFSLIQVNSPDSHPGKVRIAHARFSAWIDLSQCEVRSTARYCVKDGWRVQMRAIDVMTSEVITVDADTSVQAAAKLMAEHGISALPVIDRCNRVAGIVSEGDLLHRAETGTERRRSWWLEMMTSTNRLAEDYIQSHGSKVKDVMTRDVLSVTEKTPVADIAVLLETNRIKRVPVLRDGKLVGIVSRANLVRALAMTVGAALGGSAADDQAIRARLLAELKAQRWAEVSPANITVKDGVVHLWSSYLSDQERRALIIAAENTPGVRRVEDHMRRVPASLIQILP